MQLALAASSIGFREPEPLLPKGTTSCMRAVFPLVRSAVAGVRSPRLAADSPFGKFPGKFLTENGDPNSPNSSPNRKRRQMTGDQPGTPPLVLLSHFAEKRICVCNVRVTCKSGV